MGRLRYIRSEHNPRRRKNTALRSHTVASECESEGKEGLGASVGGGMGGREGERALESEREETEQTT